MKKPKRLKISGVLFDFDGTLTAPGGLDFAAIRAAIDCPEGETILEFISTLEPPEARDEANRILEEFELEAANRAAPNTGAEELIEYLKKTALPFGIITRNRHAAVLRSLTGFKRVKEADFKVILSRDDAFAPKPDPEGIRTAALRMGVPVEEMMVVGDFRYDVEAGSRAGAVTVFLTNREDAADLGCRPDYQVDDLAQLQDLVRQLSPLPPGKLPNDLLSRFLGATAKGDETVLIPPGVGEDVAAVLVPRSDDVLVLKSDPITFTADNLGYYAVVVNSNDVATSGATPRWFLATLLLPVGTTPAEIEECMRSLLDACAHCGVTLCGGHTEITPVVNRPTVIGSLAGTVSRTGLVRKEAIRPGDRLLVTKGIAIEGTTILARELARRLCELGVGAEELDRCRRLLDQPGISVLAEARVAAKNSGVAAMHDVTEGGLATALEELSQASGHRFRIIVDRIPVLPETERLCRVLGLDPLGLIGSGALLISCRPDSASAIQKEIRALGIAATDIGEVAGPGAGVEALAGDGSSVAWPRFEADELARALA